MEDEERQDTPQVETTEIPPAEETMEALKAQIAELEKSKEQAEKGLKTARKTLTDKDTEIKRLQDFGASIQEIKSELGIHRAFIDEFGNRPDDIEIEGSPKKPSLDDKIKDMERKNLESQFNLMASEVEEIAKEGGLDISKASELETVRDYFNSGRLDLARKGVSLAKKIVDGMKEEKETPHETEEKPKETEEQMRERLKRELAQGEGFLNPEGGIPSGTGALTLEQISNMSPEEYITNRDKILKAFENQTIK